MQSISKDLINDIKSQNDIVEVISSYIDVNSKLKALCPFHNDHNASLSIQKDKQLFKCFSCGEAGNVISFVEKIEGISFEEALKKLADRVGIKFDIKSEKKNDTFNKKYYDINNLVCSLYKNNLMSINGINARKYLSERNITNDIINTFNIGLSNKSDSVSNLLISKGYSKYDLLDIDISKESNNRIYDSFQDRITFPISDELGNVIAFSARKYNTQDLNNDELPKYYNTSDTKIFTKGLVFYNINNAHNEIRRKKEIIITEGQMDTIRVYSIGYKNTVALMGTALTKEHISKLLKYKCKVVLNLDQDSAGKNGTLSVGEELIKNGIDTSVIIFSDYKDSDEFILNKGKDAFDIAYNNRMSFIDFKLMCMKEDFNLKSTTDISKYINKAIESINSLSDDILKELKIKELSKEFNIDESVIRNKISVKEIKKEEKVAIINKKYNKYDLSELRILYLMLNYEDVIYIFENKIGSLINDDRTYLACKILEYITYNTNFDLGGFINYIDLDERAKNVLKEVNMCYNNENYTNEEIESYIKVINEYAVKKRKKELERELIDTYDINKKIEIAKKVEKMNKEVLEW